MEADKHEDFRLLLNDLIPDDGHELPPESVDVIADWHYRIAAQAREQALKEVEATMRALSLTLDDWSDGQADTANAAIDMALNQVASLTTPTAQAEVVKRIVAEWLEEQVNGPDRHLASSALSLLAALKESE